MESQELVRQMRADVRDLQAKGQVLLYVSALDAYLAALEEAAASSPQVSDEGHQARLAAFTAQTTASVEGFRAVITAGQNALKSALLINGGAAVAVLGFLSAGWSKGAPASLLADLPLAMSFFVFGVLSAAMASGATYLSQEMFGSGQQRPGTWTKGAAIALGIGSYLLFACGALLAYRAFVSA